MGYRVSSKTKGFLALLLLLFCFRLGFGLCSEFWSDDDTKQIYLIGLKFYTTHQWPYFGPDVDYSLQSPLVQIPGALQGVLVGAPFFVLPIPEAPFILLNILSFAGLCLLAWYCARRLPEVPAWIIWAWLLTAPWTLDFSTHPVNTSYVLFGAILFFVAALETYPFLTKNLLPIKWANFMMGFALFWVMQLHMSWPILLPFLFLSFYFQYRKSVLSLWRALAWFALGAILTGSLLLPTFFKYGLHQGLGGADTALTFNARNLLKFINPVEGILGRFLSYASFEVPRFLGPHTIQRLAFLKEHPWIIPFAVFLGVAGILQPIAMFFLWFLKKDSGQDWQHIKYFTLATVCLLYVSFLFTNRTPQAHTFYLVLPIAMIYSFYCWSAFLVKKRWRLFIKIFLACGIIFHTGLALHKFSRESLYVDHNAVQSAIDRKDYTLVGERRPGAR